MLFCLKVKQIDLWYVREIIYLMQFLVSNRRLTVKFLDVLTVGFNILKFKISNIMHVLIM